jgi:hypothetical protein|tara:strand:+ start:4351 stop:4608 length:258 start_codon:yes stop_codon:yes gene_type:complete
MSIAQLPTNVPLVDSEGKVKRGRAQQLLRELVQLNILTGSGSPEGVIQAKITTLYMNTAGTAGSILYIKKLADISGDISQGWILV